MPNIGIIDAFETALHLANPKTSREAVRGMQHGFLFSSGKKWSGFGGRLKEFGRRAKGGFRSAYNMSYEGGMPTLLGVTAFAAATAPRGHKASAAAAYALTGPLSAIPGAFLAGTIGGIASGFLLGPILERNAAAALQYVKETGQRTMRVNMGGGYIDTDTAYTMRQRAAQDMSGSLQNARQYLGKEAALLHS
jgi:hypothetical protein